MEKTNYILSDIEKTREYKWQQSANALFNFMRQPDYLKIALKNMAIIPRYYPEYVDYLNIKGLNRIVYPMSCFCDIPITKLGEHMDYYGEYGIGLDKEGWGLKKGLQPIKYVHADSILFKDFNEVFRKTFTQEIEINPECEILFNYLISELLFTKPIKGSMEKEGKREVRLFQDECEWRYIPKIPEDIGIELILPPAMTNTTNNYNIHSYSDALAIREECWLKFNIKNLKYIVVPNETENRNIISFILNEIENLSKEDKYLLISKIFVMKNFREDM